MSYKKFSIKVASVVDASLAPMGLRVPNELTLIIERIEPAPDSRFSGEVWWTVNSPFVTPVAELTERVRSYACSFSHYIHASCNIIVHHLIKDNERIWVCPACGQVGELPDFYPTLMLAVNKVICEPRERAEAN